MENNNVAKIVIGGIAGLILLIFLTGSIRIVNAELVGIRVTMGTVDPTPCYGLSVKWPFLSKFVKFEKTTQRVDATDATYTQDIQPADIKYVFTYKIVDANAPQLYISAGRYYEEKIILPVLRSTVKDVIGKWVAQDLVANRDQAASDIEQKLVENLPSEFFTEVSFVIDNIDYSDNFEDGIEAKVLAEQAAQTAKNRTVQIEEEARQKVIKAQGDADAAIAKAEGDAKAMVLLAESNAKAMKLEGEAISRNQQVLKLRELEVQKEMAKSASGWNTVVTGGAGTLLNIPTE